MQVPFTMLWMRASDILMMRKRMVDLIWWVKCFMTGWPRQVFLERIGGQGVRIRGELEQI